MFERVVAKVVCGRLKDSVLLSDQQFGFRPGRSTSDQLMLLTRHWQEALDDGRDTVVVVLNIAGVSEESIASRTTRKASC